MIRTTLIACFSVILMHTPLVHAADANAARDESQIGVSVEYGTQFIDFDDLKLSPPTEGKRGFDASRLPARANELAGRRAKIKGFMFPTIRQHGNKKFVLHSDDRFLGGFHAIEIDEAVVVYMRQGQVASYTTKEFTVEGEFDIHVLRYEGGVRAVYRVTEAVVNPK